ncbi:hypothetical protein ACVDFE_20850 [Lentzea chajnantorensis]
MANADENDSGLLDALVSPVAEVVAPIAQVTAPLLTPVVDTAVQTLDPVLEPLRPVTAPVLAPVVGVVRDAPPPQVVEPLVPLPSAPPEVVAPVVPAVVPEAPAVALPQQVVPAKAEQTSAPDVAPPAQTPVQLPVQSPEGQSPAVPLALPGTTGSASSSGSTGTAVPDLPALSGVHPDNASPMASGKQQFRGSWCYYYGRNHPS